MDDNGNSQTATTNSTTTEVENNGRLKLLNPSKRFKDSSTVAPVGVDDPKEVSPKDRECNRRKLMEIKAKERLEHLNLIYPASKNRGDLKLSELSLPSPPRVNGLGGERLLLFNRTTERSSLYYSEYSRIAEVRSIMGRSDFIRLCQYRAGLTVEEIIEQELFLEERGVKSKSHKNFKKRKESKERLLKTAMKLFFESEKAQEFFRARGL